MSAKGYPWMDTRARAFLLLAAAVFLSRCGPSQRSDAAFLSDLHLHAAYQIAEIYGSELTVLSFGGAPRTLQLSNEAYLFGGAVHPREPWLVGPVDGALVAADLSGKILWKDERLRRVSDPAWCASGERIALQNGDPINGTGVLYMDLPLRKVEHVSDTGRDPSWSPGCDRLLYSDHGGIVVFDIASRQATRVRDGVNPAWSPDGQRILYLSDGWYWLADLSGKPLTRLFAGEGIVVRPRWSPDSQYLMFIRRGGDGLDLGMKCPEPKQVVVYRLNDGRSAAVHQVCKGAPLEYRWIRKGLL